MSNQERKRERFMERMGYKNKIVEYNKLKKEFDAELDKNANLKEAYYSSQTPESFTDAMKYANVPQEFTAKWESYQIKAAQLNNLKERAIGKLKKEGKLEQEDADIDKEIAFESKYGKLPLSNEKDSIETFSRIEEAKQKFSENPVGVQGMKNAAEVLKSKWRGSPEEHYQRERINEAVEHRQRIKQTKEQLQKEAVETEIAKRRNHKEFLKRKEGERKGADDIRFGRSKLPPIPNEQAEEFNKRVMAEADAVEPKY